MKQKKLAVIFPGIGYHKDKPLLYYAARLAQAKGYEILALNYHDMPQKIRGDAQMMKKAAVLACEQTVEQMDEVDLKDVNELLLIGKSIGTIAAAKYASRQKISCRQVWYTPLEATFDWPSEKVAAFIGEADPWSDINRIKMLAEQNHIELHCYADCNHSLECGDVDRNIANLREVMQLTNRFMG